MEPRPKTVNADCVCVCVCVRVCVCVCVKCDDQVADLLAEQTDLTYKHLSMVRHSVLAPAAAVNVL